MTNGKTWIHSATIRRLLACLTAFVLLCGMVPFSALAAGEEGGHTHNAGGWACQQALTCGLQQGETTCGLAEGALTCGLPEQDALAGDPGHTHDGCMQDEEGNWSCGLAEGDGAVEGEPGHTHGTGCYHQHDEGCYHQHGDACYTWSCTGPEAGGPGNVPNALTPAPTGEDLRPAELELLGYLHNTDTKLTLGGKEIQAGDTIHESDLRNQELTAAFSFDLPVGDPSFEGGALVNPGTPQAGDTLTVALDPLFSVVTEGEVETIPFIVKDQVSGADIEAGTARFTADRGAPSVVLTFNDALAQRQWEALNGCFLSATLRYENQGSGGTEGTQQVTIFTKEFTIEKEDARAEGYTLAKTVVAADGSALGVSDAANVTYSQSNGQQGGFAFKTKDAITQDGQITWRIDVAAKGEATLQGLTWKDVTGGNLSVTAVKRINGDETTSELDAAAFLSEGYTFQDEAASASFLVTTQIDDAYWRVQSGTTWNNTRTVTNTAQLLAADGTQLLTAGAKVHFCAQMLVKYQGDNSSLQGTNDQLWKIKANSAAVKVDNAYVVDTFNAKNLKPAAVPGWLNVTIGNTTYSSDPQAADQLIQLAEKPAAAPVAVDAPSYYVESGKITVYLGTITQAVVITLRTTVITDENGYDSVRNDATLYGGSGQSFGTDFETFSRGRSTLAKKGVFTSDTIQWTVQATANGYKWPQDAFFCDFILADPAATSIPDEVWSDFTAHSGLTSEQAAQVQANYEKKGTLAAGQALLPGSVGYKKLNGSTDPAAPLVRSVTGADGTAIGWYIVAKLPNVAAMYELTYQTAPAAVGAAQSTWHNHAQLYYNGAFRADAPAQVSIGKKDQERLAKSFVSYDYATHTASWNIVVNQSQYKWDLFLPSAEGDPVVTDVLPQGWAATGVTLSANSGDEAEAENVPFEQAGAAVSWAIPAALRGGSQRLTYTITAQLADPTSLAAGETVVKNSATLSLAGGASYSDSCAFTIYNRQPGKTAASQSAKQITWTIKVNEAYVPYTQAYVEDYLPEGLSPLGTVDQNNDFVPTVKAYFISHDPKTGAITKGAAADVTAGYNGGENLVTIHLPEPGKGYWLEFTTQIVGPIAATGYSNTAHYITNTQSSDTGEAKIPQAQIQGGGAARQLGTLTIRKTDGTAPVDGAVFRLISLSTPGNIREAVSKNGAVTFSSVPEDTYKLEEVYPAPGFALNQAFNDSYSRFTLKELAAAAGHPSDLNIELNCVNQHALYTAALAKVDGVSRKPLGRVGFTLSSSPVLSQGSTLQTAAGNAYGYVTFPGLAAGTYYLFETGPLAGYEQPETWLLRIAVDEGGAVSYFGPDGAPWPAENTLNGTAPVVTNVKSASVVVEGQKELEGRTLNAGEFSFALHQVDLQTGEAVEGGYTAAAVNDENGAFQFTLRYGADALGGFTYQEPAAYAYAITEQAGSLTGVAYDDAVYSLLVHAWMDNGAVHTATQLFARTADGAAGAPLWEEAASLRFHNVYTPQGGPGGDEPGGGPTDTDDDTDEPTEEIPDDDVPLAGVPDSPGETLEEIPDQDVPLTDMPAGEQIAEEIPGDGVPLASLPKTGGPQGLGLLVLAFAAIGVGAAFRRGTKQS